MEMEALDKTLKTKNRALFMNESRNQKISY